jgi:hypothetical protein
MIAVVCFFSATVILIGLFFWMACGVAGIVSTMALKIHGRESLVFRVALILVLVAIKITSYNLHPEIYLLHYLDALMGLLIYLSTTIYCQKYVTRTTRT